MNYLIKLLQRKHLKDLPEWEIFLTQQSDQKEQCDPERFRKFLATLDLTPETKDLTHALNQKIYPIEQQLRQELFIDDFQSVQSIKKLLLFANCYVDFYQGLFLKEESARRLLLTNPLLTLQESLSEALYEQCIEEQTLLLLAVGRFSEAPEWNQMLMQQLETLTTDDFEIRAIDIAILDHTLFPEIAAKIINKKCFNTHDKLLGLHIATTLPETFDLEGKAPILRTVTKFIHYHQEMMLFNRCFQEIYKRYPGIFVQKISQILGQHIYAENAPIFNTNDILEGLSNRYIDQQIYKLAEDFPALKPWAEAHDIFLLHNGKPFSAALWRLTSWYLNGSIEHTAKMHRDNILADLLIQRYGQQVVEDALLLSLADQGNDVLSSIKRIKYLTQLKTTLMPTYHNAILLHHNDADGLSAGFIIEETLKKKGIKVIRHTLEILFPKAIDTLLDIHPDQPIFIVDLGTQIIHHLKERGVDRDIWIIDHHRYDPIENLGNIQILNPRYFGIEADYEGASSINATLFSLFQLKRDLSFGGIGLMGAVGDGMLRRNGDFKGLDQLVLEIAVEGKTLKWHHGKYYLPFHDGLLPLNVFVKEYLNVIGSAGYQAGGSRLAFDLLNQKIFLNDYRITKIKELKQLKYQTAINDLSKISQQYPHFLRVDVMDRFQPMGLKEIGNFLDHLIHTQDLDQNQYFFGAQTVVPVQGIGTVTEKPSVKISMRVGSEMTQKIKAGEAPDFIAMTQQYPSIPGGIHALSAAVIVPTEELEQFYTAMNDYLAKEL